MAPDGLNAFVYTNLSPRNEDFMTKMADLVDINAKQVVTK